MEGVNTSSRFPVIGNEFHVGGVRAGREPPSRSWARIRTCLIDNPKDEEFNRRQEIWSYQNRNRGVVKSLLKRIPNVPFRIKKKRMKQREIDTERDRIRETILKLPNISNMDNTIGRDSPGRSTRTRPLGLSKQSDFSFRTKEGEFSIQDFEQMDILPKVDGNNNQRDHNFKTNERNEAVPRISRRITKTSPEKGHSKLGDQSKQMSFSLNDLSKDIDDRCVSSASQSSFISSSAMENYGHSSYRLADLSARSIFDVLGNENQNEQNDADIQKGKGNSQFKISDNHKHWFKRVVGDKELIAFNEYENFARTSQPLTERGGDDAVQTGNIPPEKQYSKSGWNVYSQSLFYANKQNISNDKMFKGSKTVNPTKVGVRSIESRANDQTSVRQSDSNKLKRFDRAYQVTSQTQNRIADRLTQSRSPERFTQTKTLERTSPFQTQNNSRIYDRLGRSPERNYQDQTGNRTTSQRLHRQGKIPNTEKQFEDFRENMSPYGSPSPTRFMGEYKLTKSPAPTSPGRYFPIFPTDGSPMRKIGGGGKNKLQKTNSRSQPTVLHLQETETYIMS